MKLFDLRFVKAVFYDANGNYLAVRKVNKVEPLIKYKGRSYNYLPESSFTKRKYATHTTYYYHYNINNPMPLVMKSSTEAVLSPKVYNHILENDLIMKLTPRKLGLLGLLTPKNIIIVLAILAAVYYFASGGTLT